MIVGTPTPDSMPAKAYRKSCIISGRGCFNSFQTSLIANLIFWKFHSLMALILSVALIRIPSRKSKKRSARVITKHKRRIARPEVYQSGDEEVWLGEEVRCLVVDVLQGMHPLTRSPYDSHEILYRRHLAIDCYKTFEIEEVRIRQVFLEEGKSGQGQ